MRDAGGVSMLAFLLLASTAARGAQASPGPYDIFDRAREVCAAQRYPDVVAYTVDVVAARDDAPEHRHYHEYWSAWDDQTFIKPPVSDEQLEHPYVPSAGVNFMGWNIGGPRTGSGDRDFIGPPLLAPNYSFGLCTYTPPQDLTPTQLVEQIRQEYHDPAPQKVDELSRRSGLKTIAMVSASARAYRIALAGVVADEGGGEDFHLTLQPLRDPLKYRLRDLWIDTVTYQPRRARVGGNFTDTATEHVSWMVQFQQIDGVTYISRERAEAPIVGYHGLMYSTYDVSFESVHAGGLPAYATATSVSDPLVEPQ